MKQPISITAISAISPLGDTQELVWKNYLNQQHCFVRRSYDSNTVLVAPLSEAINRSVADLRQSDTKYKQLDNTVLYAILAARSAMQIAGWRASDNFGINIGSSRGATALFEQHHEAFLKHNKTATLASPTTTLGNISSWVAHDLQTQGPEISHSITCSTAMHSILNGIAWLQSGMASKFLVGGSEAPLTAFTIAQMQALKIYARTKVDVPTGENYQYPCRALDLDKTENTMILGEAAAMACLEVGTVQNALALIIGAGYATEPLEHNVSISTDAVCFQRSMSMALGAISPNEVDVIVMHAPGTKKGDATEYTAIKKIFPDKMPFLTTNKWKVGHSFGTSGMLNLELAVLMLQHQKVIPVPFIAYQAAPKRIQKVLVNAVGFGGNAVSVLLSVTGN